MAAPRPDAPPVTTRRDYGAFLGGCHTQAAGVNSRCSALRAEQPAMSSSLMPLSDRRDEIQGAADLVLRAVRRDDEIRDPDLVGDCGSGRGLPLSSPMIAMSAGELAPSRSSIVR